ncbi:unnamed protein product [Schistosoma margrebowiei]|uniref:Uncharacterized protein n=1 Tax=Schistosoma margrebowiei TaxID=48269 RepID=A0A183MMC2_9TREM|nr:unnamed protein product [Schistosoma margrebowiei]
MMVEGSQQETLDLDLVLLDTCQQDVPVILRELMLLDGFDAMSHGFTFGDLYILRVDTSSYMLVANKIHFWNISSFYIEQSSGIFVKHWLYK